MPHRKAATSTDSPTSSISSSKQKGDSFEKEVAQILGLMPGAHHVEQHKKIGGKDVDLYVELKEAFSGDVRIAVDAKDYDKPITRERASLEHSSYYPLVANGDVDQFMLITRNGRRMSPGA